MANLTVRVILLPVLLFAVSAVMADQVTVSYVDAGGNAQNLTVDASSSEADLALAASLMGEEGVGLLHDPDNGTGTLAEVAGALAAAAPIYAADVAEQLAMLSPDDTVAIVEAVNAVPGVNTKAVLAAVHFGPYDKQSGPQSLGSDSAISLELTEIEQVPSRN